jgi:hypothetical protein
MAIIMIRVEKDNVAGEDAAVFRATVRGFIRQMRHRCRRDPQWYGL